MGKAEKAVPAVQPLLSIDTHPVMAPAKVLLHPAAADTFYPGITRYLFACFPKGPRVRSNPRPRRGMCAAGRAALEHEMMAVLKANRIPQGAAAKMAARPDTVSPSFPARFQKPCIGAEPRERGARGGNAAAI